jgi:hypothetical protein
MQSEEVSESVVLNNFCVYDNDENVYEFKVSIYVATNRFVPRSTNVWCCLIIAKLSAQPDCLLVEEWNNSRPADVCPELESLTTGTDRPCNNRTRL